MRRFSAAIASVLAVSCGGSVLDLGQDAPPDGNVPRRYASDGTDVGGGMPTVIAARQYGCTGLALDETRVYWSTQRADPLASVDSESEVVRSCEKNNCAATVVSYASSQPYGRALVVDQARVYWVGSPGAPSETSIVACPIRGCDGPPTVVVVNVGPVGFTVDDSYVYWLDARGGLLRCSLGGCQGAPTLIASVDVPLSTGEPRSLAVDATHLYWITRDGNPSALGSIMTVPKDGSSPHRAVVAGAHLPRESVIDQARLFWTEESAAATIQSCPLADCATDPAVLASRQPYPQFLALGRESAFWFTSVDGASSFSQRGWVGQLVECPITGCGSPPSVLATEQGSPRAMAVDATHVYWTTYSEHPSSEPIFDGAVKRLRRRP